MPQDTPLGRRTNCLFLGTSVVSGTARLLVVRTGRDTEFGQISGSLRLRPPETGFERGIRRFGYLLLEKDLRVLERGVREGRVTLANTMKYIFMATSANFGNMFSMAGASLFLSFLPLLPKQVLLVNLLTDLPEMTIATDSVDQPPAANRDSGGRRPYAPPAILAAGSTSWLRTVASHLSRRAGSDRTALSRHRGSGKIRFPPQGGGTRESDRIVISIGPIGTVISRPTVGFVVNLVLAPTYARRPQIPGHRMGPGMSQPAKSGRSANPQVSPSEMRPIILRWPGGPRRRSGRLRRVPAVHTRRARSRTDARP